MNRIETKSSRKYLKQVIFDFSGNFVSQERKNTMKITKCRQSHVLTKI